MPDPRVGQRQKACSLVCQKLRKRENNRSFRVRNPEYWLGRYEEVKDWRQKHPDYQRQWRRARKRGRSVAEIQAERLSKVLEFTEKIYSYLCEIQAQIPFQPWEPLRQTPHFFLRAP